LPSHYKKSPNTKRQKKAFVLLVIFCPLTSITQGKAAFQKIGLAKDYAKTVWSFTPLCSIKNQPPYGQGFVMLFAVSPFFLIANYSVFFTLPNSPSHHPTHKVW